MKNEFSPEHKNSLNDVLVFFWNYPQYVSGYSVYKAFVIHIFIANRYNQSYKNYQMYDTTEFQMIPAR